jgi:hypothetical protein
MLCAVDLGIADHGTHVPVEEPSTASIADFDIRSGMDGGDDKTRGRLTPGLLLPCLIQRKPPSI